VTATVSPNSQSVQPGVWLPIHQLRIDPTINRPLNRQRVHTIAEKFDPDAIGVLTVSVRPDGTYLLLDGQHRLAALRQAGWDGQQKVPCDLRHGLSQVQEVALFVKLNNTAKPKYIHRFYAASPPATPSPSTSTASQPKPDSRSAISRPTGTSPPSKP
jgi:hypothetical protein